MDHLEQALQRTLVTRCQVGDRQAFEALFLRYNRPLGYYLRRMLNRDEVGDVQQEVWLTVIRGIARLRRPEAFVVWFYQVARSKALNRLVARRESLSLDGEDLPTDEMEDSEDRFSASDSARIHEAIATLNPAHRDVLLLRFMEDLSYEQIAAVVQCSTGTVRSRLHYAKRALLQELEKRP
ncbi:MAG TPA: sigma-70 family RNA polymerase sigma factor [Isosphaeraceae bacterium]|jgi:RNA polymerase sigma-70 factor (ECF subfamily)|nr:sigma-70 family RNA polymerase sigma factor [Isosphaeraceae bacterium]